MRALTDFMVLLTLVVIAVIAYKILHAPDSQATKNVLKQKTRNISNGKQKRY